MGYNGIRVDHLYFKKAAGSALDKNRLIVITKSTNTGAYAGVGSVPDCVTTGVAESADVDASGYPINAMKKTFFLVAASSIAVGDYVFPVTDGKAVASSYTASTRGIAAQPSPGADAIYLLPGTVSGASWTGHANAVAIYTQSGTSWAYVDVSSTANVGLTVYVSDEKKYYSWNGTAWVVAKSVAISNEVATAGQTFEAYNVKSNNKIDVHNLPDNLNYGIVLMGQYSGNPGGVTVTILDSRIAAGDKAFCQFQGGTTAAYVVKAVTTAGTLTLTLSADSGANSLISYAIVRQL